MSTTTPKYIALCSIQRDAKTYNAGDVLPAMPAATVEHLLHTDPPAIALAPEPAAPAAPTRANARDTIAAVKAETEIPALLALREAEEAHADGARATVLAAIDARLQELGAAADDGDDEDAGT